MRRSFDLTHEAGSLEWAMGSVWDVELPEQARQVEGFGDYAFAEEDYLGFRLARDNETRANFGTSWTDDPVRARHVGVEADNPGVKHEVVSFRLCVDEEGTWKKTD
jgi:hypothetical protein